MWLAERVWLGDSHTLQAQLLDPSASTTAQFQAFPLAKQGILSRKLLNAGAPVGANIASVPSAGDEGNTVLQVTTALEFVDAIAAETAHIVVVEHLNLDDIPSGSAEFQKILTDGIPPKVLSITVRLHIYTCT